MEALDRNVKNYTYTDLFLFLILFLYYLKL